MGGTSAPRRLRESPGSSAHLVSRNMSSSPPREELADEKIISDRSEAALMTSSNNEISARGWRWRGRGENGLMNKRWGKKIQKKKKIELKLEDSQRLWLLV